MILPAPRPWSCSQDSQLAGEEGETRPASPRPWLTWGALPFAASYCFLPGVCVYRFAFVFMVTSPLAHKLREQRGSNCSRSHPRSPTHACTQEALNKMCAAGTEQTNLMLLSRKFNVAPKVANVVTCIYKELCK